jgi:hypothetical protein
VGARWISSGRRDQPGATCRASAMSAADIEERLFREIGISPAKRPASSDGCKAFPPGCPGNAGLPACVAGVCGYAALGGAPPPVEGGTGSPPPPADAGAATCDERASNAASVVAAAVDAHLTCAADADCQAVSIDSGCHFGCGAIVNAAGVAAVQSAIDGVNAGGCSTYASDGCKAFPPPCAPTGLPACVAGECGYAPLGAAPPPVEGGTGSPPPPADAGAPTCDQRKAAAEAVVTAAVDAHLACASDADCHSVSLASGCFDECTRNVNAAGAAAVQAAIDSVNAGGCSSYTADGCTLFLPPCVAPTAAACSAGQCM